MLQRVHKVFSFQKRRTQYNKTKFSLTVTIEPAKLVQDIG